MSTGLHAHVFRHSSDCDGSYERGYMDVLTEEERSSPFGDLNFQTRVVADLISFADGGHLWVKESGVVWEEPTEEGHVHVDVEWCSEDCDVPAWQRDLRAESMGY